MSIDTHFPCGLRRVCSLLAVVLLLPFAAGTASAQEEDEEAIDEIVTTGSQIRGAKISDALAVSLMTASDIEELGVDSGDELIEFMAEQGSNFFTEAESISGGVNSARGDIGAYNLRNLGTGNTLVLLNGRRLVNSASYQTERVGGSFIPVNTVNSQSLPVFGLERVEVLRDGASAIYGADAVAGVVNYVMKTDFDGLSIRARYADWEDMPRNDAKLTFEWGKNFNGGRTNLSVFGSYYKREPVNAQDDPKWADSDFRRLIPEGSPFEGDTSFRRTSINSAYGQYDIPPDGSGAVPYGLDDRGVTDSRGEFQFHPFGSVECDWAYNENVCGSVDNPRNERWNLYGQNDLLGDLDRTHLFVFLNHDFGNGLESFTEASAYISETVTQRHRSTKLGAVAKFTIAPDAYYNPFGPCGSPNRLPFSVIGDDTDGGVPCTGIEILMDNHGWVEVPRVVNNDGDTFRILQGFRGQMGNWDWETALSWSRATKEDITNNRFSNTLMQAALNDTTEAGYNPFNAAIDTNYEQALINVRRDNETELTLIDFKLSHPEIFEMPAGPVGFLAGVEWREESFSDERDPRLNGTIEFVDNAGNGFPIVSDVMNSSPTLDSKGDRDVLSVFTELQIPLLESLDMQLAVRYEDFSDIGDTTVGKVALGWRPIESLLFRGSWSEAYRVPNLVTVNESGVARSNTVQDQVCLYVDPNQDVLTCGYSIQRTAGGSADLIPEESTNTSIGVVWDVGEYLTFTLDYWEIDKEDTIGLFGEQNHTALDLLRLIEAGTGDCANVVGNPRVTRGDPDTLDPDEVVPLFVAAGICPVARAIQVSDTYANLDTRNVKGHDIGVYANYETEMIGAFDLRFIMTRLDDYDQLPSGPSQVLLDAEEAGVLPPGSIQGFADLTRQNGNPRNKYSGRLRWFMGDWGATVTGTRVTDVVETRAGLGSDGSKWIIEPLSVYNASVDYSFEMLGNIDSRLRFGVNNITDARASLSSQYFGYFADVNRDMPRSYYLDLRMDFF